MPRIFLMYRLNSGYTPEDHEAWIQETDYPVMRGQRSVKSFATYRTEANFFDRTRPAYDYIEVLDVDDLDAFRADLATPDLQRLLTSFQAFAQDPKIIVAEEL